MNGADTSATFDDAFISVWRQALVEQKKIASVAGATFSVRRTSKHRLAQIDFQMDGVEFRALEQNPQTKSRGQKWLSRARKSCNLCAQASTLA
jgi:hypothetical protein